MNFLWKTVEGGGRGRKASFCYFLLFGVALIVGGWEVVGRKSYLGPAEIASFSSRDLSRRNKHDHSGLLHQLDISTFYFYDPLLFQIFFLWKFINIYSFPLLPSLLQPTAKQITISINIFICFKYYTVWNQSFIKIHVKVCYIQVWFKREIPPLSFLIKSMVYRLL